MNTPAGNTLSTAEHTIAMMLALSRNIAPAYQSLIEGNWDRNSYMGTQLADKTLGIVGLGRIGQAVATRAKALRNARARLRPVPVDASGLRNWASSRSPPWPTCCRRSII